MKTGDVGKTDVGGIEIDETCGGTGTGLIYEFGMVDGTIEIGTITYVVTSGIVTTGIDDGINLTGIITGDVGKYLVDGYEILVGIGETYVGTVITTELGIDDGSSLGGTITAVVDCKTNTQCVNGAHDPGMITGETNV
jgi:hypothetical protein